MTAPTELDVDALAQEIRRVDGNNSLGAGALAEALMPFLSALPASESLSAQSAQPQAGEPVGAFEYCDGCSGYECGPTKGCAYPDVSPQPANPAQVTDAVRKAGDKAIDELIDTFGSSLGAMSSHDLADLAASQLAEKQKQLDELPSKALWDESRKALASMRNEVGELKRQLAEARAEYLSASKDAMELAGKLNTAEAERDRLAADNVRKDAELRDRDRLIHHLVSWIEDDVGAELPLDEDQFNLARSIRAALAGKE
jgi:hypothetical protein